MALSLMKEVLLQVWRSYESFWNRYLNPFGPSELTGWKLYNQRIGQWVVCALIAYSGYEAGSALGGL
tara:strand:- start:230 stop:430 length:201 start_codon:yes stop_codon:yes gene_type:complete